MMHPPEPFTIWGITELSCWLGHRNPVAASPSGHDAEDCLDAHLAAGIRHVVWDLGRSVLCYHSDLAESTCRGFQGGEEGWRVIDRVIEKIHRERCQLRAALRYRHERGMVLYGRLCMNRHYRSHPLHRSRFAEQHPEWCELGKDGWLDPTRLSFAIPQYRAERVNILMEAAEIGVDGLHLDFCRQPPFVRYHPALTNGYYQERGIHPQSIPVEEKALFLDWCQYRAGFITEMLRELKAKVAVFRSRWLHPLPIQIRIPNDGFEANLIAGLDPQTWVEEGLVDELMLSELHWLEAGQSYSDEPYLDLGRKAGIPVYASSNCLPLQAGGWGGAVNPAGIDPEALAQRTLRSHAMGASGVALYQTDTGVQHPQLQSLIALMGDRESLEQALQQARVMAGKHRNPDFGIDNHSKIPAPFRLTSPYHSDGV